MIEGVQLILTRGEEPVFYLMLCTDGTIKRAGTGRMNEGSGDMFVGAVKEPLFEEFMRRLPPSVTELYGKGIKVGRSLPPNLKEANSEELLELKLLTKSSSGKTQGVSFFWGPEDHGDLPLEVTDLMLNAVEITDDWYWHFRQLSRQNRTLAELDQALEQNPSDPETLFYRAGRRAEEGRLEGALEDLTASIALDDSQPAAFLSRGKLLMAMGRDLQAVADFEVVMRALPEQASSRLHRGACLKRLQEPEAALESFREAVSLDPELREQVDEEFRELL